MIEQGLLLAFPAIMILAAGCDLMTMTIPNRLSLALVAGFVALAILLKLPLETALWHVAAGAITLFIGFILFACGWMGGGDAKLAAATALWLGLGPLLDYAAVTAVAGGILTLVILLVRRWPLPGFAKGWSWLKRLHDSGNGVPYGIALACAALFVYPRSPFVVLAMHS